MTGPDAGTAEAARQLRELALSGARAAAVRAAARLRVADALGERPAGAAVLAEALGVDADSLRRLLRALVCHGVFAEAEDDRFAHNRLSRLLRADSPHSLRDLVLWSTEPWTWELWPLLDRAVRTGSPMLFAVHGKKFFDYLHDDAPESAAVFDRAMSQASALSVRAVTDALDLSSTKVLADVAGGQGHQLAACLARHPALRGVLLDLPGVVADADPRLRDGGEFSDRAEVVAADCLEGIPVTADAYLVKNVLEWNDEATLALLRNIAVAAEPDARVLVVENLLDGGRGADVSIAMDLLLMLNIGGKRHTAKGLLALIDEAGLTTVDVAPITSYLHLVECAVPRR
ncbi:methyltransferase [Amycolatopsis sp. NPDC003676]